MRLYTVSWQGRTLICLQTGADRLAPLPYETMNHLLADDPAHRQKVLDQAAKGPGGIALSTVRVLAPAPAPAGCDLPGHELPEAQNRGRAV